jgi:hypothetical protein
MEVFMNDREISDIENLSTFGKGNSAIYELS